VVCRDRKWRTNTPAADAAIHHARAQPRLSPDGSKFAVAVCGDVQLVDVATLPELVPPVYDGIVPGSSMWPLFTEKVKRTLEL